MKKIILIISCLISAVAGLAQKAEWKEMHAFHAVMSKTFHPAEEGKIKPVHDNAANLLAKAAAWQKSTVPKGYNATVTRPILNSLVDKCTELQNAVTQKKDKETLTRLITEAHNIFHEIMEKCRK